MTSSIASNSIFKVWDQELARNQPTERNFRIRSRNSSNATDLTTEVAQVELVRSHSIDSLPVVPEISVDLTPNLSTQKPPVKSEAVVAVRPTVNVKQEDIPTQRVETEPIPTTPTKVAEKPARSPARTTSKKALYSSSKPPSRPPPPIYHLHVIVKAQAIIRGWLSRKAFVKRSNKSSL